MRIEVEIRDSINPTTALECVKQVIAEGKISRDGGEESHIIAGLPLFSLMKAQLWYILATTERTIAF